MGVVRWWNLCRVQQLMHVSMAASAHLKRVEAQSSSTGTPEGLRNDKVCLGNLKRSNANWYGYKNTTVKQTTSPFSGH